MSKRNGKTTGQRLVAYWESGSPGKLKRHPKEPKWPDRNATELERVKALVEFLSMTSHLLMCSALLSSYPEGDWGTGRVAFHPALQDLERRLANLQVLVGRYIKALEQDEAKRGNKGRRSRG